MLVTAVFCFFYLALALKKAGEEQRDSGAYEKSGYADKLHAYINRSQGRQRVKPQRVSDDLGLCDLPYERYNAVDNKETYCIAQGTILRIL